MPRLKLSDEEKRKKGTLKKSRQKADEQLLPAAIQSNNLTAGKSTVIPARPKWLRGDAKKLWDEIFQVVPPGHLQPTDLTLLERWVRTYHEWRLMAKKVEGGNYFTEEGYLSPAYKAYIQLGKVLAQCEKELGFTPVSRARVRVADEEPEASEYDDL